MWQHNYTPIHGSLLLSSLVAALPIFVLLFLLGVRRAPAWIAALWGLGTTVFLSIRYARRKDRVGGHLRRSLWVVPHRLDRYLGGVPVPLDARYGQI